MSSTAKITLVDRFGNPLSPNGKPRSLPMPPDDPIAYRQAKRAAIKARYDLAETTTDNVKHWAQSDSFDADSANSRHVRQTMVRRSRYETENNGYVGGLTRTHATFLIRTGPRLRLTSKDEHELDETTEVKDRIKADWHAWCKAIKFRRKLWCMAHAKIQDGEPLAVVRHNPKVKHQVKLDVVPIETEQCQTPMLAVGVPGYIDGIRFDPWGNPLYYDILPQHPGSLGLSSSIQPDHIPARYVLHWYEMQRPGQHRGVPSMRSTLGLGAGARRWREATLSGAETIADIALIAQTQGAPLDGPDEFAPFGTIEWQKRMMMMLPMGWNVFQPQGTQPPANYEMFTRAHISESARPLSMPYNLAASDSSSHSFASGRLDTIPYYMVIDDLEREDCNDLVLDPLFCLWWQEYVLIKQEKGRMLESDPDNPPSHDWDWPKNPVADEGAETGTNAEKMRTGQAAPSDIAHANGESFEDLLRRMARDYGKSIDEMREALFTVTVAPKSGGTADGIGEHSEGYETNDGTQGQDAAGRSRPVPNQTAPSMEQMSMMVAQLTESVGKLAAIVAAQQGAQA